MRWASRASWHDFGEKSYEVAGGSVTVTPMSAPLAAVGSVIAGVVLALVGVLGGVSAITPSANPTEASDAVVLYDAR